MDKQNKQSNDFEDDYTPGLRIISTTHKIHQHDVYISGVIGPAEHYVGLCHLLRTASEQDVINLYINSEGGYVSTGIQLLNSIAGSQAHIKTVLDGDAHSMASFLALAGDEIIVLPHASWMAHNFSAGYYGKANETDLRLICDREQFENICKVYYKNFLTKKEIKSILDGKDLWLNEKDIVKRLKGREKQEDTDE